MTALAEHMLAWFEKEVMALRCDWLDESAEKTAVRYAPFVDERHPKRVHFASLLAAEERYYCEEVCVRILEQDDQVTYLDQQRKRLHDLFLRQLRLGDEQYMADELESVFEQERFSITATRSKFLQFGQNVVTLLDQMNYTNRHAKDEYDEAEVRRLAAQVMRTVRLERRNLKLYVP